MSGLEIVVLFIFAICALVGYFRGFLRVAYSIAAWVLVFVFVAFATPHLADFLEKNTGLKEAVQEKCADYIGKMAEERIAQEAEGYGIGGDDLGADGMMDEIMGSAALVVGGMLEGSGLYDEVAGEIAHFIIEGIAFFAAMVIVGMLIFWISHMLDLVSKIPIVQGPNRVLGAVVGGLKGLVIVWLMFYVVQMCAASEFGARCMRDIEESLFLKVLYENNLLFLVLRGFMRG